jgi:adenosylcobinamide kinase/adenosylcobinamide-phosphate guanylyltransferase
LNSPIHFILGGSRSGKSRYAEKIAENAGLPVCFIATYSESIPDEEMRIRVEEHRKRRPTHWETIEDRFDLRNLIVEKEGSALLLDCLTLWLSESLIKSRANDVLVELGESLRVAVEVRRSLVIVSNEVGMDLAPLTPEGRAFRDLCGSANQLVARYATCVELVVAGLPLRLKGG